MKNVKQADVSGEREPDNNISLPIARRGFCSACGTSLTFQYLESTDKNGPDRRHFDDPSRFRPTSHFGAESMHRAWIDTTDLPQTRSDGYQPLNDRWMNAVGRPPE